MKLYTYFIYVGFSTNDGNATEITVVNDLPFKLDSLENINKLYIRLVDELNGKLLLQGLKAVTLIIKNFILINQSDTDPNNN